MSDAPKKILLVGHCGPDSSYLRMTIKNAEPKATILAADDDGELKHALDGDVDLVLFNRDLGYGFAKSMGVDQIRALKSSHPSLRTMLVSNYPDAQEAAVKAGALPGFGKRELGSARVTLLIRDALAGQPAPGASPARS